MTILAWIIFLLIVVALLALDLGVLNKNPHEISTSEALKMTALWVGCALLFSIAIFFTYQFDWFSLRSSSPDATIHNGDGFDAGLQYLTGWLIEKSLSLDNIFVMVMLFTYFKVPNKYQHEVLFWGILGALVFRGVMIVLGAALVNKFSWIMYVFGVLLIISALKMMFGKDDEFDADKSTIIKIIRKIYPVSSTLEGDKFFTRIDGIRAVTPLFVVLMVIETTDVMFAVDSIPAVFSITTDSFIVFTSNIFAILGLRSLYFVLASVMNKFEYLKVSLFVLLLFIGVKMLLMDIVHISIGMSLSIIALILGVGILASYIHSRRIAKDNNE
ncbi:MAG: TerC family protein [Bacteroidales bacterium]|nr:TerC family protein [Bacteroidales bacterium]